MFLCAFSQKRRFSRKGVSGGDRADRADVEKSATRHIDAVEAGAGIRPMKGRCPVAAEN
jgi:hypothetical protein